MKGLSGLGDIALEVRDDGALQLLLPGADAFSRGGEEPKASLRDTLDRIAAVLAPMTATDIQIFGHTDSMASELHNLQLSIRRAEKVAEHLRMHGVALSRLRADGKGESEPIADNRTEEGRAKNRRVEIVVRPLLR
ncbi:OmpA family protein [Aromatoleum sp.]|uniref:OmpA family protein n=1 Tax=Aromatoleum sp. TaxID=2307007 RepID=UPI002FC871E8